MKLVTGTTLRLSAPRWFGLLGPNRVGGYEFRDCLFDNCVVRRAWRPDRRFTIRDVVLHNCQQRACMLAGAAVEDVVLDGLRRLGDIPLFAWAAVFKHVVLSGRIGSFIFNQSAGLRCSPATQQLWDAANAAYYSGIDWALDISAAQFGSFPDFHFVPGRLVRRDSQSQFLVSRQQAKDALAARVVPAPSALEVCLGRFLAKGLYDDIVIVAAKGARYFKQDLQVLETLRTQGYAE